MRYVQRYLPAFLYRSLLSDQRVLEAITSNVLPSLSFTHNEIVDGLAMFRAISGDGDVELMVEGGVMRGRSQRAHAPPPNNMWEQYVGTIKYALDGSCVLCLGGIRSATDTHL